jgi:hypothetical protein
MARDDGTRAPARSAQRSAHPRDAVLEVVCSIEQNWTILPVQ